MACNPGVEVDFILARRNLPSRGRSAGRGCSMAGKTVCRGGAPQMSRIKRTDRDTTEACIAAILTLLWGQQSTNAEMSAAVRQRLGPGWTLTAALQWLSGRKAWACVEAISPKGSLGGVSQAAAVACVQLATELCRESGVGGGGEASWQRLQAWKAASPAQAALLAQVALTGAQGEQSL